MLYFVFACNVLDFPQELVKIFVKIYRQKPRVFVAPQQWEFQLGL